MLLVKLIRIAFILKDLDLGQFFIGQKSIDIPALIAHISQFDKSVIIGIAKIATDDKSIDNEVDATLALTAFFLPLAVQLSTSPQLPKLMESLACLQSLMPKAQPNPDISESAGKI